MMSKGEMGSKEFNTPAVESWLNNYAPNTAVVSENIWKHFMNWVRVNGGEFAEFTAEDFIKYQQEAKNSDRYKIVRLLRDYINWSAKNKQARAGYQRKIISTVRSFFKYNYEPLPQDPSLIIRSQKMRVIGTLTLEEAKRIILGCNARYQAVFLSMLQGGLGRAEFEYWNSNGWDNLRAQLKDEPEYIRIDLPGRKKRRNIEPYHTWVASDTITAIRSWLRERPENAEAIITNKYGRPVNGPALQMYWLRELDRHGLIHRKQGNEISTRYGKSVHELRTLFRSQWTKSGAHPSAGEYYMGHIVDRLDYDRAAQDDPEWAFKQYRKFSPYIQIMSNPRAFGQVKEDIVEDLRQRNLDLKTQLNGLEAGKVQELRQEVNEMKKLLKFLYENPEAALKEKELRSKGKGKQNE